ncbi:MAG: DUF1553 domain-containing protein [Planctomycetes bacterium]|nr:DUF1553 domain-containing protein [Planctomycetota bacterium]
MLKLEVLSLGDRVRHQLLEQLLAGELAPGTRLREVELAAKLGVSRTPVREALSDLARDGLLELLPNRGAVVRQLGADELRHIYQLREALEGLAAELACAHVTDADVRLMERLLGRAVKGSRSFAAACLAVDQELHRLVAARSCNPILAAEIRRFHDLVQLVRERVDAGTEPLENALAEHRAIVAALAARDPAAARAAMTTHIRNSLEVALRHALDNDDSTHRPLKSRKRRASNIVASLLLPVCLTLGLRDGATHAIAAESAVPSDKVDFVRDIRPLLSAKCVACHGPEEQAGKLRWDRRADALRGGESGPAIVAGRSGESLLIEMISSTAGDASMPPEGERLTVDEVALVRRWIDEGAIWPEGVDVPMDGVAEAEQKSHWAFQPLVRPALPPATSARSAGQNPIDRFIAAKLLEKGLQPSPPADPATLLRRLKFDLLGLPPTWEETQAAASTKYEQLVDQYLASPHFGERWARHWLDVVRFAESNGFETNLVRPSAWPYRDYVIDAFNTDKPYDRFVLEQLAGDQLAADPATGFLVAGPWDKVKSPDPVLTANQRADELHDMVGTTGSVFLGLTVGCARCHNHKFDPISQVDYYALKAVFAGVQHGERPWRVETDPAEVAKLAELQGRQAEVEKKLLTYRDLLRPAVTRFANEERFEPIETELLRFTITATNNGSEPCIDELEVFTAEPQPRNIALATHKTSAKGETNFPRSDRHKLEHINDGQYGNGRSWISGTKGTGMMQLRFEKPVRIDRVVWSRDRAADGRYTDRLPVGYYIEVATSPGKWKVVASSDDRLPYGTEPDASRIREKSTLSAAERERIAALAKESRELSLAITALDKAPMIYAGKFQQPEAVYRFHRGDPMQQREAIAPGALAKFGAPIMLSPESPEHERRLALARWIVDPKNPLTARVIVNRLWQGHFGRGLVDTPSDFGLNGARPTHPELLDWLAAELIDHGWSLKHIHRLIVTSATFQQSSQAAIGDRRTAIDADNVWLWRSSPRRLEAEPLRDAILAVAGNLNPKRGGPGFDLFEQNDNYVKVYDSKHEFSDNERRRMIYQAKPRMQLDDVFGAFDCPDAGQTAPKRTRSTTPLQALNLLNSPFLLEQSKVFAARIEREAGAKRDDQVRQAFRLALAREADNAELAEAVQLVERHGLSALCRALFNANEFLYAF